MSYLFYVVWQQVHMCPSSLRSTRLLELLDAILNKGMKVIIFTTTVNDVCFIMEVSSLDIFILNKLPRSMELSIKPNAFAKKYILFQGFFFIVN